MALSVSRICEQLAQRDVPDEEFETIRDGQEINAMLRGHEIVPPALLTNGTRNLMRRLCEEADVDVDDD